MKNSHKALLITSTMIILSFVIDKLWGIQSFDTGLQPIILYFVVLTCLNTDNDK